MKITSKKNSRSYKRDNITSYLLVSEEGVGAEQITTTLVEMRPGGKQHIHKHPTEQSYFIIEGKGKMTVGDEEREVAEGMSIFIPSNEPHGLINESSRTLRYLSSGSPPFGKENEIKLWPIECKSRVSLSEKERLLETSMKK